MLDTSKDLLNLVLAVSITVFTGFLCWGLFYIAMILRRGDKVLKEVSEVIASVKEKIEKIERLIDTLEEKISHSASYLPLLFKGITELIGFFKNKKGKSKQKKTE